MALLEIDKRLVNAKIDFLISASKFKILFVTNFSLALLRRQRPNILRYTLLYATRSIVITVIVCTVQLALTKKKLFTLAKTSLNP